MKIYHLQRRQAFHHCLMTSMIIFHLALSQPSDLPRQQLDLFHLTLLQREEDDQLRFQRELHHYQPQLKRELHLQLQREEIYDVLLELVSLLIVSISSTQQEVLTPRCSACSIAHHVLKDQSKSLSERLINRLE